MDLAFLAFVDYNWSMHGEVLETAQAWSLNRGTEEDVRASRKVVEWLQTPDGVEAKKEVAGVLTQMWDRDHLQDEYLGLASLGSGILTAVHHAEKRGLQEMDVYALEQAGLLFWRLAKRQAQTERPSMVFHAARSLSWPSITLNTTEETCSFFGILAERIERLRSQPGDASNRQTLQRLFVGLSERARAKARALTYDDLP
jgi:hypothetical protein